MRSSDVERAIRATVVVEAGLDEVWEAWTTEQGVRTFFAPDARVEPKAGGVYEIYFDPQAEPGSRGGEGVRILALQPKTMLAFTWNAPPHLPEVRRQWTHVVVRLHRLGPNRTRVTLSHDGWGTGGQWDRAFEYFQRAWIQVVLPRLQHRFSVGPVNWEHPPKLKSAGMDRSVPEESRDHGGPE
jgi:uncharacterized protein YndB with AHSA1/START domain